MFWPFLELDGELVYCPLADFGLNSVRTGQDIYAHAIVGQPVTAHTPLYNALAVSGTIAVVQRGMCNFVTKVWHAQQAGAVAVLVANNIGVGKGEAFVMDGGHCPNKMLAQVTIPAMMLSRALSLRIFAQIRHADLDHTDLYVTIRFLGAEIASQVLAQQEQHKQPRWHGEEIRERQQQEAATLLRNRLDTPKLTKAVGFSNNTSDTSNSIDNQLLEPSQEGNHQDQTATSTNLHWCPMATTAVLVLDVQNYFTLPHANNVKEDVLDVVSRKQFPRVSDPAYYACIDTKLIPTVQDVLFACRERKNMEIVYSVVESATCDGRERSQLHKHAGIYVPKRSDGAQMPTRIKPRDSDIVLPRTGVKYVQYLFLFFTFYSANDIFACSVVYSRPRILTFSCKI